MKISARNVLEGTVKEVKKGATTSHILICKSFNLI